ncbi:hypothetical protein MIND_00411400 [Mycena indigotica]|uniref:Uncharacterized protein n=1 Tax=Mycena indigotica TaxID=2126181 RepID=A0A8H6W572_9AGAR|nr:uncharacterized protein MIND_00411400 [Mycena indigotica]KAF7306209.1 hypothetical protein MIND_00411400 [Mycena indigotica]
MARQANRQSTVPPTGTATSSNRKRSHVAASASDDDLYETEPAVVIDVNAELAAFSHKTGLSQARIIGMIRKSGGLVEALHAFSKMVGEDWGLGGSQAAVRVKAEPEEHHVELSPQDADSEAAESPSPVRKRARVSSLPTLSAPPIRAVTHPPISKAAPLSSGRSKPSTSGHEYLKQAGFTAKRVSSSSKPKSRARG